MRGKHAIKCACGTTHWVSATALVVIVEAFLTGDMQTVTGTGIDPMCIARYLDTAELSGLAKSRIGRVAYE